MLPYTVAESFQKVTEVELKVGKFPLLKSKMADLETEFSIKVKSSLCFRQFGTKKIFTVFRPFCVKNDTPWAASRVNKRGNIPP